MECTSNTCPSTNRGRSIQGQVSSATLNVLTLSLDSLGRALLVNDIKYVDPPKDIAPEFLNNAAIRVYWTEQGPYKEGWYEGVIAEVTASRYHNPLFTIKWDSGTISEHVNLLNKRTKWQISEASLRQAMNLSEEYKGATGEARHPLTKRLEILRQLVDAPTRAEIVEPDMSKQSSFPKAPGKKRSHEPGSDDAMEVVEQAKPVAKKARKQ